MDMQVEVHSADASPAESVMFRYGWLYQLVQQWVRVELEQRIRFVTSLHQNGYQYMRLFHGGLRKLGPLPVLAPSYLQFLNWKSRSLGSRMRLGRGTADLCNGDDLSNGVDTGSYAHAAGHLSQPA